MIVVTGGTGHVGRELVAQLAGSGAAVRAVTRRPGAVAFLAGVDVVVDVVKGDFDDRASLTGWPATGMAPRSPRSALTSLATS